MHAPVPYSRPRPPVAVSPLIRDDVALSQIAAHDWNQLAGNLPLLSHEYFSALHRTRCAAPETGWTPRFLTAWDQAKLIGLRTAEMHLLLANALKYAHPAGVPVHMAVSCDSHADGTLVVSVSDVPNSAPDWPSGIVIEPFFSVSPIVTGPPAAVLPVMVQFEPVSAKSP